MLANLTGDPFDHRIFVINLKRRAQRWRHAHIQLISQGFLAQNIQRVEAVDGQYLFENNRTYLRKILSVDAMKKIREKTRSSPEQLTVGAVGCALSHVSIWRDMVEKNISSAIVFEDDLRFHWGFAALFKHRWQHVPQGWDLIYLGCLHKKKPVRINRYFNKPRSVYLSHAYMLNTRAARILLSGAFPLEVQIDHYINSRLKMLGAYAFRFPRFIPMVWQKRFPSDIQIPLRRRVE